MKESYKKAVLIWLATGAILVMSMVVVGGITRLTHSGLSMTDWKPISGIIPPLSESDWNEEFEGYKRSPEFQKVNYHFGLEEFKSIFWWEYIHRVLGRVIGMVFLFPFLFFLWKKVFDKKWITHLVILFLLGGLQGFLGWFMVKSGLVDQPSVSHYRLAIHLSAALTVCCYIIWLMMDLFPPKYIDGPISKSKKITLALFISVCIQIVFGAFVAGMKAGLIFNTWPKMGGVWVSPLVNDALSNTGFIALFDDPVTVQFIHRILPYLILLLIVLLWRSGSPEVKKHALLIGAIWCSQFLLGIFTLLYRVPVSLGVLHQLVAAFLLISVLVLIYRFKTTANQQLQP